MVSYFKAPITNKVPYKDITLYQLYKAIAGDYYKQRTSLLRELPIQEYKKQKPIILDFVTFAGIFQQRNEGGLVNLSGLMCLDFDHLKNSEILKRNLLKDPALSIQMMFLSPGGDGLKVIIKNPASAMTYSMEYEKLMNHIWRRYGIKVDKTQDIARACFVCHDPDVWISQEVKLEKMIADNPAIKGFIDRLDL